MTEMTTCLQIPQVEAFIANKTGYKVSFSIKERLTDEPPYTYRHVGTFTLPNGAEKKVRLALDGDKTKTYSLVTLGDENFGIGGTEVVLNPCRGNEASIQLNARTYRPRWGAEPFHVLMADTFQAYSS